MVGAEPQAKPVERLARSRGHGIVKPRTVAVVGAAGGIRTAYAHRRRHPQVARAHVNLAPLRHDRPQFARKVEAAPRETLQKLVHAEQRRALVQLSHRAALLDLLGRIAPWIVAPDDKHGIALGSDHELVALQHRHVDACRARLWRIPEEHVHKPLSRIPRDLRLAAERLPKERLQLLRRKLHDLRRLLRDHDVEPAFLERHGIRRERPANRRRYDCSFHLFILSTNCRPRLSSRRRTTQSPRRTLSRRVSRIACSCPLPGAS